ncbi:MAG TPA: HEAT repeat domain-containing protein, partial [Candidatus Binataceae bacterium]
EVCPWNASSTEPDYELAPYLPDLMALDAAGFSRRFSKSAIRRAKRRGLLRNVAVALGNSRNPQAVPVLARALEFEPEALIRAHAAWAIGNLGGSRGRAALERAHMREEDSAVLAEIGIALEIIR